MQLRILNIEDSEDDSLLMQRELKRNGYDVKMERVETRQGITEALTTRRWDVIVCDHNLPGLTSKHVLEIIQDFHLDIPFIILSGSIGEEAAVEAMRSGAHDYIMKDNLARLVPAIERELRDMETRLAKKRAEEENIRLAAFPRENPNPVMTADNKGNIIYLNPMSGLILNELNINLNEFLPDNHDELVQQCLENKRSSGNIEKTIGERTFLWLYHPHSSMELVLLFGTDITDMKKAQAHIEYIAYHDILTGLSNRNHFLMQTANALTRVKDSSEKKVALLFVDVDRFNLINDSLGHVVGDSLLVAISKRLLETANDCTIARLSGDEFTILLEDVSDIQETVDLGKCILKAMEHPFHIHEHDIYTSVSIGISMNAPHVLTPEDLFRDADTAMYFAKNQGRNNLQFFTTLMNERAKERLHIETNLRRAIEKNELYLVYQPQVDILTGNIIGFETLLRWNHNGENISPSKFIPVAEESGLIIPIGDWILKQALQQLRLWQDQGYQNVLLAVNLSSVQLQNKNLHQKVSEFIKDYGVIPGTLELELTESALMIDPENCLIVLTRLKDAGIHISLDDFGTGYSSLSYLKKFPIDTLKIDRSFVQDITSDPDDAAITLAIIAMSRSLKMKVVAEGVETEEQLDFLRRNGCEMIQGHFASRPVTSAEITELLRTKKNLLFPGKVT